MHPYHQAILLPDIYPKEILQHVHKEACEKNCYSIVCKSKILEIT